MSTELLIAIQAAFAVIVAIVILLLIIRRQKQTIAQLKDILNSQTAIKVARIFEVHVPHIPLYTNDIS